VFRVLRIGRERSIAACQQIAHNDVASSDPIDVRQVPSIRGDGAEEIDLTCGSPHEPITPRRRAREPLGLQMGACFLNGRRLFRVLARDAFVNGPRLCVAQLGVAVSHSEQRPCRKGAFTRELARDTLIKLDRLLQIAAGALGGERLLKQVVSALRNRRRGLKDEQSSGGEQREPGVHSHESPLLSGRSNVTGGAWADMS